MSVVTAQQAALAANLDKAVAVVDRIEQCVAMIVSKCVTGVVSLQRHLKHSMKQLQLWQSVAGITASQLLAVAALMDSTADDDEVDYGGLLSAAVASHHTSGLTWRAVWRQPSSSVFVCTVKPLMATAKGLSVKVDPVRLRVPCGF